MKLNFFGDRSLATGKVYSFCEIQSRAATFGWWRDDWLREKCTLFAKFKVERPLLDGGETIGYEKSVLFLRNSGLSGHFWMVARRSAARKVCSFCAGSQRGYWKHLLILDKVGVIRSKKLVRIFRKNIWENAVFRYHNCKGFM